MNAETFNGLIKQVPRLTLRQRTLLRKRLDELDDQQQGLAVIESQSATQPRCCPHCQDTALDLHGQVNGLQRNRCQACQRTFNALTGTALARLRKKDKWLGFGGALVASQPLRKTAATLGGASQHHAALAASLPERYQGRPCSDAQGRCRSRRDLFPGVAQGLLQAGPAGPPAWR